MGMRTAAAPATRRRGNSTRTGGVRRVVIAGLGLCAVVLVAVAVLGARTAGPRADEITAFEAAINEPIQHWGKVEVLGMRPAIFDLRRGAGVPATAIAQEAREWQKGLAQIGRQFDSVRAPSSESQALHLFKRALADYVNAAALVERATAAEPGTARNALLDQAIAGAQHGDCVYDDGAVAIQQARQQAGLPTTIDYPDHPCAAKSATP
jgi:hypothetical protein